MQAVAMVYLVDKKYLRWEFIKENDQEKKFFLFFMVAFIVTYDHRRTCMDVPPPYSRKKTNLSFLLGPVLAPVQAVVHLDLAPEQDVVPGSLLLSLLWDEEICSRWDLLGLNNFLNLIGHKEVKN